MAKIRAKPPLFYKCVPCKMSAIFHMNMLYRNKQVFINIARYI